ncbi:amidohydrolase family protein [candidate division KSB1 bacterium]|nr:amidohydrolase family protein [candidate division KSB1 bacterium]
MGGKTPVKRSSADKILIKGSRVFDVRNNDWQDHDLLIVEGVIEKTGEIDATGFEGQVVEAKGYLAIPGLFDMHVHVREPGREDEETIESACQAALAGGITGFCAMPDTQPVRDTQEGVRFALKRAEPEMVRLFPVAALSKGRQGKELTEMAELLRTGAVAFSDDDAPVSQAQVMRRGLEYASMYKALIISHCEDLSLSAEGEMNESFQSTRLGMHGIPNASEEVMVHRDLSLVRLTGARLHIAHVSTWESVEWIRRAKQEGLPVTCEVTPHHLWYNDKELESFDTNLKVNPPLRTERDVDALLSGLKDGTIDVIVSEHSPHSIEEKDVEFDAAPCGAIGMEILLGVSLQKLVKDGVLTLEEWIAKVCINPRTILGLPVPEIAVGQSAELTLFSPDLTWTVDRQKLYSLSRNTPFHGIKVPGRVLAVFNQGDWALFETKRVHRI